MDAFGYSGFDSKPFDDVTHVGARYLVARSGAEQRLSGREPPMLTVGHPLFENIECSWVDADGACTFSFPVQNPYGGADEVDVLGFESKSFTSPKPGSVQSGEKCPVAELRVRAE